VHATHGLHHLHDVGLPHGLHGVLLADATPGTVDEPGIAQTRGFDGSGSRGGGAPARAGGSVSVAPPAPPAARAGARWHPHTRRQGRTRGRAGGVGAAGDALDEGLGAGDVLTLRAPLGAQEARGVGAAVGRGVAHEAGAAVGRQCVEQLFDALLSRASSIERPRSPFTPVRPVMFTRDEAKMGALVVQG
jgi:hypothetical protein